MPSARLGLIVPKKGNPKAVRRNRIKRIVRDSFRRHYARLILGLRTSCRRRRNQVYTTRVEWMAPADSFRAQQRTAPGTMNSDAFHRVMTAGGVKAALATDPEAQRQLITANQQ